VLVDESSSSQSSQEEEEEEESEIMEEEEYGLEEEEMRKNEKTPSTLAEYLKWKEEAKNHGILYVSSFLPPLVQISEVRNFFEQYGKVVRLYFNVKKRRKTRVIQFGDGWVEMEDKELAETIALNLVGKPMIFGKKQFWERLWEMRYLEGYTWYDLDIDDTGEKMRRLFERKTRMQHEKKKAEIYVERVMRERAKKRAGKWVKMHSLFLFFLFSFCLEGWEEEVETTTHARAREER